MALLIFHLVLSSVTSDGVDINMAQKILDWNLKTLNDITYYSTIPDIICSRLYYIPS